MTTVPEISGLGVSPGRAAGPVATMPDPVAEPSASGSVPEAEREREGGRIRAAALAVRRALEARAGAAAGPAREVLEATALMAADPALVDAAVDKVSREGLTPERAVWVAAGEIMATLAGLGGYLAGRVRDVEDVRDRLVAEIGGRPTPGIPVRPGPYVLVARDLAPADTATLDPRTVAAIVTAEGSPTSHTAILARELALPAVVAAPDALAISEGTMVLVDGYSGTVTVEPDPGQVAAAAEPTSSRWSGVGGTADGHRVHLLANVGDPRGALAAADAGAEGVGLFRTEFCFLDRTEAPSVDEQVSAYRSALAAFPGRRVVVRTLDAGADKPLPFLSPRPEPNPALGVRGLRTAQREPQVLEDQLEAISRAARAEGADVWVMAPMVATVAEAAHFVTRCAAHGLETSGVMVETPAAALSADHILGAAGFVSIGTNDLAQYAMAADRQLGALAALTDPWQPSVLRLVGLTGRAGAEHGRHVGVCGEAAADPALACVLVGLGVTSLSMAPRAIAGVGAVLAATPMAECVRLAGVAVEAASARQARETVQEALGLLGQLGA